MTIPTLVPRPTTVAGLLLAGLLAMDPPAAAQRVALPDTAQRVALPAAVQRVALPDTAQRIALPDTAQRIALPDTAQRIALPAAAQRVAPQATAQAVASEATPGDASEPRVVAPAGPLPAVPMPSVWGPRSADAGLPVVYNVRTGREQWLPRPVPAASTPPSPASAGAPPPAWSDSAFLGPMDEHDPGWSPTCRLVVTYLDGTSFQATGTLIDARTVLTAGHVVHQGPGGNWAMNVTVSPGWDGDDDLASTCDSALLGSIGGWTLHGDAQHDIGWVRLDEPLGFVAGWHDFAAADDATLAAWPWLIGGYPVGSCFDGAPDQLQGALGFWDVIGPYTLESSASWPCWMGGMDGGAAFHAAGSDITVDGVLASGSGSAGGTIGVTATRLDSTKVGFLANSFIPNAYPATSYDLTVLACRADVSTVGQGMPLDVSFVVANDSLVPAPFGTWDFDVVVSANDFITAADPVLASGFYVQGSFGGVQAAPLTIQVTVPTSFTPGEYHLGIRLENVDGNPSNDATSGWHSHPLKIIDNSPYEPLGGGLAGAGGLPNLLGNGDLTPGSTNSLGLFGAASNAAGALFVSLQQSAVPFKGGVIQAFQLPTPVIAVITTTDFAGTFLLDWTYTGWAPFGTDVFAQWVLVDPTGPQGYAMSSALRMTLQ